MINKYQNFISERLGVADPTDRIVLFIADEFKKFFDDFFKGKKDKHKEIWTYDPNDIPNVISGDEWYKFPVSKMRIEYNFEKHTNAKFHSQWPVTANSRNYNTNGGCAPLKEGRGNLSLYSLIIDPIDNRSDSTIYLSIDLGGSINKDKFDYEKDIDGFIVEIEALVGHELNHAYENWNRYLSGAGDIAASLTHGVDINRSRIAKPIFKYWNKDLGYFIYCSEPHEINAMTQEAWSYVKRYDIAEVKKTHPWEVAEDMVKFNAETFKTNLVAEIRKHNPGLDTNRVLNALKNGLANQIDKTSKEFKDEPSIKGDSIRELDFDEFLEFCQDRINSRGKELQRRILRLYGRK